MEMIEKEQVFQQNEEQEQREMEEAYYWFTINEFVELILRYGPQRVIPDFEGQMEKAKALFKDKPIIIPQQ